MTEIPAEIVERRDAYCEQHSLAVEDLLGWGLDGFVWHTTQDSILKVFRHDEDSRQELLVYRRLQSRGVERLHGFHVPQLLNYDANLLVLELSFVRPPYILDFAAATLDDPPLGFDPESPEWTADGQRKFGRHWPEVVRLLDALKQIGIHYRDVHQENIRVSP